MECKWKVEPGRPGNEAKQHVHGNRKYYSTNVKKKLIGSGCMYWYIFNNLYLKTNALIR